jgi:hypothetical protein
MKTRPGMIDDAARARAVTPTTPPFTERDRSSYLTAGRNRQARVPARQSARRPIISRKIIGRGDQREPSAPPGLPGTLAAQNSDSLKWIACSGRDGARRARAGPAPGRPNAASNAALLSIPKRSGRDTAPPGGSPRRRRSPGRHASESRNGRGLQIATSLGAQRDQLPPTKTSSTLFCSSRYT